MSNLVKIPLLVALWGSFAAHAGIAETGIICGGADYTRQSAYLRIRLIPRNGVYDLTLDRVSLNNTVNLVGRTLASGLKCKFQEEPVIKANCVGTDGPAQTPVHFRMTQQITRNDDYFQSGYHIEAQSDGVAAVKDQGFDGENIWPADSQPSADDVLNLLLAGGYGCRPMSPDVLYAGRSVGLSDK